jgi:NAD(P)-dependent dehydrogenase (short-subunit alcohol dehydrogenase family)
MQKLAVITGGNTGLGFFTAQRALAEGFDVLLASRSLERASAARIELLKEFNDSNISIGKVDLSDLNSVSDFVEKLNRGWDVLINNAGAKIQKPFKTTTQGFEWHIGVNHLGHFALTAGLLPKANHDSTVVTVSSIVARNGKLDFLRDIPASEFNERQAYANSKLMNLMFAMELSSRLGSKQIKSVAAHPGFARAGSYGNKIIRASEYVLAQSARLGSQSIWAATKQVGGSYSAPRHFELWGEAAEGHVPEIDPKTRELFWDQSELLSGVRFDL